MILEVRGRGEEGEDVHDRAAGADRVPLAAGVLRVPRTGRMPPVVLLRRDGRAVVGDLNREAVALEPVGIGAAIEVDDAVGDRIAVGEDADAVVEEARLARPEPSEHHAVGADPVILDQAVLEPDIGAVAGDDADPGAADDAVLEARHGAVRIERDARPGLARGEGLEGDGSVRQAFGDEARAAAEGPLGVGLEADDGAGIDAERRCGAGALDDVRELRGSPRRACRDRGRS